MITCSWAAPQSRIALTTGSGHEVKKDQGFPFPPYHINGKSDGAGECLDLSMGNSKLHLKVLDQIAISGIKNVPTAQNCAYLRKALVKFSIGSHQNLTEQR